MSTPNHDQRLADAIARERYAATHCPHRKGITESEYEREQRVSCIVILAILAALALAGVSFGVHYLLRGVLH